MQNPTKVIIAVGVCSIVAVSTILLASNLNHSNRLEPLSITIQDVNMSGHPEATQVTKEKDGHLTFTQ